METAPTSVARRRLGLTDLEVSVIGIGANTFGPPRLDEHASRSVIDAALDMGVNFIDTAIVYGQGLSEEFIGRSLGLRRDRMIIATKFNMRVPGEGSVRERIFAQAETSLRKLGTDYIDLYQIHTAYAPAAPEEILGAMNELLVAGKVRAIGACNYSSWRLAESAVAARTTGATPFATVQNYYHLLAREAESEVVPWCAQNGTSVIPYHPLGGGFLTGKYRDGQPAPAGTRGAAGSPIVDHMSTPANFATLAQLEAFCAEAGHTVGELAIAWLLANPVVGSVITGVSSPAQLQANVVASSWHVTPEQKSLVDHIVSGPLGRPLDPETPPYAMG